MNKEFMPRFLTAEEMQVLAENVKFFREQDGISIEELARRMDQPLAYIKGIEEGKRTLPYNIVEDLAASFDVLADDLLPSCEASKDEEADDEYVVENEDEYSSNIEKLKALLNECDMGELCFLNYMLPILGNMYRNSTCRYCAVKHDGSWGSLSRDEYIDSILSYVDKTAPREEVFFINAIELSIKQIRMGFYTNYIPFPSLRIDPQLTALLYVLDHQNECEVFPNNYNECCACASLID